MKSINNILVVLTMHKIANVQDIADYMLRLWRQILLNLLHLLAWGTVSGCSSFNLRLPLGQNYKESSAYIAASDSGGLSPVYEPKK